MHPSQQGDKGSWTVFRMGLISRYLQKVSHCTGAVPGKGNECHPELKASGIGMDLKLGHTEIKSWPQRAPTEGGL